MKKKTRDDLLSSVLREMRFQNDPAKRQALQTIGEGLVWEYKDMSKTKTKADIQKNSAT